MTNSDHKLTVAPNLVNREFVADNRDRLCVSDISYIGTKEGWLYLAVVIDKFSRQVAGSSMIDRLKDDLMVNALRQAITRRNPLPGFIFHAGRGSQHAGRRFRSFFTTMELLSRARAAKATVVICC